MTVNKYLQKLLSLHGIDDALNKIYIGGGFDMNIYESEVTERANDLFKKQLENGDDDEDVYTPVTNNDSNIAAAIVASIDADTNTVDNSQYENQSVKSSSSVAPDTPVTNNDSNIAAAIVASIVADTNTDVDDTSNIDGSVIAAITSTVTDPSSMELKALAERDTHSRDRHTQQQTCR